MFKSGSHVVFAFSVHRRIFDPSHCKRLPLLPGILSKADYLKELGVGTVWLSPIFSSPMADFGYDVSNFTAVEPLFGTMDDFDALRAALHDRGESGSLRNLLWLC